jgi:hypothetical protein
MMYKILEPFDLPDSTEEVEAQKYRERRRTIGPGLRNNEGPGKKGQPMNEPVKERWSKLFLDQEETVENLARMASVAENRCFATFGEVAAVGDDWEDALFTIRHLVSMIDRFRDDYFAAIREDISHPRVTDLGDNAIEGAARPLAYEMLPPLNAVGAHDGLQKSG